MSALPPAIFLMGPTASGKTDLAIALAQALPCEIISVDSALVYREMDIGTAKPDARLLAEFPHRLINIRDAAESYSAAEFREDALAAMADITAAGRIPLLVGGTMLYFRTLMEGLAEMPAADTQVRAELEAWAHTAGLAALHAELARVDAVSAARIHPNDPQRLIRALGVSCQRANYDRASFSTAGAKCAGCGGIALYCRAHGHCTRATRDATCAHCPAFWSHVGAGFSGRSGAVTRTSRTAFGIALDSRGGIPASMGIPRRPVRLRRNDGARHSRNAPTGETPIYMAAELASAAVLVGQLGRK